MANALAETAVPASSPTRSKVPRRFKMQSLTPWIGLVVLLSIWTGSVRLLEIPSYILPTPAAVLTALWSGIAVAPTNPLGYYIPLWGTLSNAAIGFFIGVA